MGSANVASITSHHSHLSCATLTCVSAQLYPDRFAKQLASQSFARPLGPWASEAICATIPWSVTRRNNIFYATTRDDGGELIHLEAARRICNQCPVRAECLAHAVQTYEDQGIWAGTTPDQRKRLRRYITIRNLPATPAVMRTLILTWLPLTKPQQLEAIRNNRVDMSRDRRMQR